MSFYNYPEWKEFREAILEIDGYRCTRCKKTKEDAVLQVHHRLYIAGRLPWEYGTEQCETLCKRCHAAEHGIVQPGVGWEFVVQEDLGSVSGYCENSGCGKSIRYECLVYHPVWGYLIVGTHCCDNLTDSEIASNQRESELRYQQRKARFIKSSRWKRKKETTLSIKQANFEIEIEVLENYCSLTIHNRKSSKKYKTVNAAKETAFDVIASGELIDYFKTKGIHFYIK